MTRNRIIILVLFFSYSYLFCYEYDSSRTNNRIKVGLELIRKDQSFLCLPQNNNCKSITFYINDTLYCPCIRYSTLKKLYPELGKSDLINMEKYYSECFNKDISELIFSKLSKDFKNPNSTDTIYISIMDSNLIGFLILSNTKVKTIKGIEFYIFFNSNDQIENFYIKEYVVSE
jgi:hypothetical protein